MIARNVTRSPRRIAVVLTLAALSSGLPQQAQADPDAARGAVIFALAGGCGCHTPEGGPVGAGGRELPTPFGTFYGTNITPDADTGLGAWSDEEIIAAIRRGDARGKGAEAPVMPYAQYAGMADQDVQDLVAFLRTLPPVRRQNREAKVSIPIPRLAYRVWRLLFAGSVEPLGDVPQKGPDRGRYLANHVGICGDCHTPRNAFGALAADMHFAGTRRGPDGHPVPNITPDEETGLGTWDVSDLTQLVHSGMKPDFDNVQGLMAEVVDGRGGGPGYGRAPEADLRAIAVYLKTLKPIRHEVD
jgi:mono/diheme cytochrome c family protein